MLLAWILLIILKIDRDECKMLIGWYLDLSCFPEDLYLKILEDQEKASALAVQISISRSTGHKSEVYSSAIHGLKERIFSF